MKKNTLNVIVITWIITLLVTVCITIMEQLFGAAAVFVAAVFSLPIMFVIMLIMDYYRVVKTKNDLCKRHDELFI